MGGPGSVEDCGTPSDAISFSEIDASVWPPQAGKPLTLIDKWTLAEPLTAGSYERVTTTWPTGRASEQSLPFEYPVPVLFGSFLYGPYRSQQWTQLPLPAGPYNQTLTLNVLPRLRGRQIGVELNGFDATGRQVVCMQIVIPVK